MRRAYEAGFRTAVQMIVAGLSKPADAQARKAAEKESGGKPSPVKDAPEDGTVEWNYSTGGAFREGALRNSGAINVFGAVAYLRREFPELGFDNARTRQVLRAWMDSYSVH